jgi:Transposase
MAGGAGTKGIPGNPVRQGGRVGAILVREPAALTILDLPAESRSLEAVLTGVANATSESLNRLAKLEARMAYGFRNPANQRRRVRIACTRGTRRSARTAATRRRRSVTSQLPNPG